MIQVISSSGYYIDTPSDARFVSMRDYQYWDTPTFIKSLNQTLVIQTYIDSFIKIRRQDTINLMISRHLINNSKECAQFYYSFSRIVFRPITSIVCKANRISSFKQRSHHYSVQLRTGGDLANSREKRYFIRPEKWNSTVASIRQFIKEDHNCSIYISTDSTQLLEYTMNHLNSTCQISYMKEYPRGHSTLGIGGNDYINNMMGAMFELIVLSRAERAITTSGSTFGDYAVNLCQCKSALVR